MFKKLKELIKNLKCKIKCFFCCIIKNEKTEIETVIVDC